MAIRFKPSDNPPCLYCGNPQTKDETPSTAPAMERWYQCPHCYRKFAVRAIPSKPASKKVH